MGEVDTHRKLGSKNNFISWERGFERAAEANDTLEHLTGEEVIPPKPKKNDYFVKPVDVESRRSARESSQEDFNSSRLTMATKQIIPRLF